MYIKVDCNEIEKTKKEVENYVALVEQQMQVADNAMEALKATWQGDDANQAYIKWESLQDSTSTTYAMKKELDAYAAILNITLQEYRKAQNNVLLSALKLPM